MSEKGPIRLRCTDGVDADELQSNYGYARIEGTNEKTDHDHKNDNESHHVYKDRFLSG